VCLFGGACGLLCSTDIAQDDCQQHSCSSLLACQVQLLCWALFE
jgi:hypothetical protein